MGSVKELQRLVTKRKTTQMKTADIPLPHKDTVPSQLNSHFTPYGLMAGGIWMGRPMREDKMRTIYFHWPRVLGTLPRFPSFEPVPLLYTGLMVWGFSEIFKRRNSVYYEFLRRRLLNSYAVRFGDRDFFKRMPVLTPAENHVMGVVSTEVLDIKDPMMPVLRKAFADTLEKASGMMDSKRPRKELEHFLPPVIDGMSYWNTEVTRYWERVVFEKIPKPIIKTPKNDYFRREFKSPVLRELIFARDIPSNNEVVFGVRRSLKISLPQRITLVDLGDFADYRTATGVKFYEEIRQKLKKPKASWRELATEMVFQFQAQIKGLTAPGRDYAPFYAFIEEVFSDAGLDHILFIPQKAVEDRLVARDKTTAIREVHTFGYRKPGRIKSAVIESPPIVSADNKLYRFQVALRRKKVYISVPWKIPPAEIIAPASQQREFRPGVYYDRVADKPYCTHKVLMRMPDSPLRMYPQLNEWLKGYINLSTERYKELLEDSKRRFVDELHRKAGHRVRYTAEEDQIILRLYKPGMTKADKEKILEVCVGRKWEAIRVRASSMCARMLESGCTDISLLPVCNYNAKVRIMIAKNKEQAQCQLNLNEASSA